MIKAGLVGALASFVYVMSLTLVSPFCTVCITPPLGIGVGYLANRFDKPIKLTSSLSVGAVAGGIAGIAALVAQMLATVVNGILVTNWSGLPAMVRAWGLVQFPRAPEYWQTTLLTNSFCSVVNLVIIVALGMLGGMMWFQRHHKVMAVS